MFARLAPGNPRYHENLGLILHAQKRMGEAIAAYREAIRLNRDYGPPYRNLAWVLATCPEPMVRDPAEAVKLAKKAVELRAKRSSPQWWFDNHFGRAQRRARPE